MHQIACTKYILKNKKTSLALLFSLLLCVLLFTGCKQKSKLPFTIEATVQGVKEGSEGLLIAPNPLSGYTDTLARANAESGKFLFEGEVVEPRYAYFIIPDQQGQVLSLFVEGGPIGLQISGKLSNLHSAKIKGSDLNDAFVSASASLQSSNEELDKIGMLLYGEVLLSETTRDSLNQVFLALAKEQVNIALAYAQKHPESMVSPVLLHSTRSQDYACEETIAALNAFTNSVKNSLFSQAIQKQITALAASKKGQLAVGSKADELIGKNPLGNLIALSNVRGKLTLIQFWASWCGYCRKEAPNLVRLYNQYHKDNNEGLNILGVSLDNKQKAWEQAIAAEGMVWPHISDLKGWQSDLATLYGVKSIPYFVLIDAAGNVLVKGVQGLALEAAIVRGLSE